MNSQLPLSPTHSLHSALRVSTILALNSSIRYVHGFFCLTLQKCKHRKDRDLGLPSSSVYPHTLRTVPGTDLQLIVVVEITQLLPTSTTTLYSL